MSYESLRPYAEGRDVQILDALCRAPSQRVAAASLGMHPRGVEKALARLRKRAGLVPSTPLGDVAQLVTSARADSADEVKDLRKKLAAAERVIEALGTVSPPPRAEVRKGKAAKHFVRVIVPDSHGMHIDPQALGALLADLETLVVAEVVLLGDHLDCGGTFSAHQRSYTHEMTESYASDVGAANAMLDEIMKRAPNARYYYLEGNHEQHVERWAARNFDSFDDARMVVDHIGPEGVLQLKARGIEYFRRSEMYHNLSVPGIIRLGKCHFTHGMYHAKHADAQHLQRVGANIVFGHVHRSMSVGERTVACEALGAWCPGTLAKLQPLYRHTAPTSWQHGYAIQFANASTGTFAHFNVPIYAGESYLRNVVDSVRSENVQAAE